MCLNLEDYLFKTNRYSCRSTYKNPMETTSQNLEYTKTREKRIQAYW